MSYPSLQTLSYTVPANDVVQINRFAQFLTCLEASAPFIIAIDGQPETSFQTGITYTPTDGFKEVVIINTTNTPLTVTVAFGKGDIKDNRSAIAGTIQTRVALPDVFNSFAPITIAATSTGVLFAADTLRVEAMIYNAGPGVVLIAGAGDPAGAGQRLAELGTAIINTGAAIRAENVNGVPLVVYTSETGFSS
jgi:hypothetical protein